MKDPAIVSRLTRQLRSRGVKGARSMAKARLKKFGLLDSSGRLTVKGKKRNSMSPAQRAKSRAAKATGRNPRKYKYNPRTNRATLKR